MIPSDTFLPACPVCGTRWGLHKLPACTPVSVRAADVAPVPTQPSSADARPIESGVVAIRHPVAGDVWTYNRDGAQLVIQEAGNLRVRCVILSGLNAPGRRQWGMKQFLENHTFSHLDSCVQIPDRRSTTRVGRRDYDNRTGLPKGRDGDALYGRRASDPR